MVRQIAEHVTEDGEKRYRVRYRLGGKETSETFRRYTDAEMFRDLLGDSRDDRVTEALGWLAAKQSDAQTQTFGEWFEVWLSQLTGITKRTRADYQAQHRRYLTGLDALPLPHVSRAHVAGIVNGLDDKGLSPKTIKNVVHMLGTVMRVAQEDGLVARNPVRQVRLPTQSLDEEQIRFLTHEEFRILAVATEVRYQPLVAFLVGTGLRWSEATALQARHVDLSAGTVRVDRAWKRIPGGFELGPPKTRKAKRTVNAATLALLAVEPLLRSPSDLVFETIQGRVVRHSNFYNRIWLPAVKGTSLDPRPSPKDLRHTHASWLLSDGVPLEAVQDQLGHESYETTRRLYAHLLPAVGVATGRSASAALERALPQGLPGAAPAALSQRTNVG